MRILKNKKGFTLIELLAVIVILGLLMAIAIPSVTKYITNSRKKTVATTIGNYIGALTNEVNDMEYIFTEPNTVYAVPIECIALERGGKNPFGEWYQANDNYWAYVLVQYDDAASSYIYGFTFKDSAGYGIYPTTSEKINSSGKQVQTGLDLKQPTDGKVKGITEVDNWLGFNVDEDTDLVVLEATEDSSKVDGTNTCLLCQKGKNYDEVENEDEGPKQAYAIFSESDNSLYFYKNNDAVAIGDVYNDKIVTSIFDDVENISYERDEIIPWADYAEVIEKVVVVEEIIPISTAYWFSAFENCSYLDLSNLKTLKVKNMEGMFMDTGVATTTFNLVGLNTWDTSSVINMKYLFQGIGYNATNWNIGDVSNWKTSNVEDMTAMFNAAGYYSTKWEFNLSKWDTSNVTNMGDMFSNAGSESQTFNLIGLNGWNTSNVTEMIGMFNNAGNKATTWSMGDLSNWDTSKVTDISFMFSGAGSNAPNFDIGDLSNWKTSNVTTMSLAFKNAGENATTFHIGDLSGWDTSSVIFMYNMFEGAGLNANWSLDCSSWNTTNVKFYMDFNLGVEEKVKLPVWNKKEN